mmetsp:Transcript_19737/g.49826  ORF Transcript_19737/g.49826 Transcript_19737/m.49826 type:complete len:137 (-) Transcript_19737:11-421(-)
MASACAGSRSAKVGPASGSLAGHLASRSTRASQPLRGIRLGAPRRQVSRTCRALFGGLFGGGKDKAGGGKKGAQKDCRNCKGVGNLPCKACKGTGRNRANGNMLERWKCYDCQGFGLVACPKCGKAGLTPEQRGER